MQLWLTQQEELQTLIGLYTKNRGGRELYPRLSLTRAGYLNPFDVKTTGVL